jgi:hypothetical protein
MYRVLGESDLTVKKFEKLISKRLVNHYKVEQLLPDYLELLRQVEVTRDHKVLRLIHNKNTRISLHLVPSNYKIPAHTHSDKFSFTYLQHGDLRIKQSSVLLNSESFECHLKSHQACAGLLKFRNIHSLQTIASPSIFMSIRMTKMYEPFPYVLKKIRSVIISISLFLFPSFISPNLFAGDNGKQINTPGDYKINIEKQVILANKLRTGEGGLTKDYYKAIQLYKVASKKGNAEAQYWLGVMCFDGLGITDDRDDAMYWLALSSDQNYSPAQKLLHHLLVTDEVLDC